MKSLIAIADSFWRLLLPLGGLMAAGLWLDRHTGHKQLFVLCGIGLGFVVAGLLLWQQYRVTSSNNSHRNV